MLVERKRARINGVDYTAYFPDVGYTVEYVKRTGSNGGMLQSGEMEEDLLDRKAVVTFPCVPLTDEKTSKILSAAFDDVYALLEYYDPWRRERRLIMAIVDVSEQRYRGFGSDGNPYWTGLTFTFTEK